MAASKLYPCLYCSHVSETKRTGREHLTDKHPRQLVAALKKSGILVRIAGAKP